MTNETKLSPEAEADLARYMLLDSADMPNSMAVNQEQLRQNASSEQTYPRSKYYGVYMNRGDNAGTFPFRAALRLGNSNNGSKPSYMNLGYFKCEHVAGIAYNVAALNMFGSGAWLNPIDPEIADKEEYDRFKNLRAEHIVTATEKVKAIHAAGKQLRYVDLEQSAQTAGQS